jgi:hypothetical protein
VVSRLHCCSRQQRHKEHRFGETGWRMPDPATAVCLMPRTSMTALENPGMKSSINAECGADSAG